MNEVVSKFVLSMKCWLEVLAWEYRRVRLGIKKWCSVTFFCLSLSSYAQEEVIRDIIQRTDSATLW